MSDEKSAAGGPELVELMKKGFLVGLVRQLKHRYDDADEGLCEDAVYEAAVRYAEQKEKGGAVRDVMSYIAKIAHTTMKKSLERATQHEFPHDPERHDSEVDSAEEDALRLAAVSAIKQEIRRWSNAHIREVMLVYLEAAVAGEPMEAQEVAQIVGQILGEDIKVTSVWKWKSRGMQDLRTFVYDAQIINTGNFDGVKEDM